ncbi:hypothetical protein [Streptomyces rimosus]|uniref:hypothetical protein n=1 Tax=Streptomyces rimosus TaxID=1927 RepID=UPI000519D121|nr:hypothetical protein [Streptomyces rimosus]
MAVPALGSWAQREVITASKLNGQIRAPQIYLSNSPRLSCRGVAPGQTVPKGKKTYVRWTPPALNAGFKADASAQWFTVPDSGIYVLSASLTAKPGAVQEAGDGLMLYIYTRTANGTQTSVATVREVIQQPKGIQIASVCTVAHLQAGESIGVAAYLDSGSKSPSFALQTGAWEGLFSAFMVGPGATSMTSPIALPAPIEDWTDDSPITPATMNARVTRPLQALYSPPRFICRAVTPYSSPSGKRRLIPWKASAFEQCGGWTLSKDGTAFTAPLPGVYLLAFFTSVRRGGPAGPFGSFQSNVLHNGKVVSLHQRQNTRADYGSSIAATELVFLNAGDTVSTDFMGTGTGLTWQNSGGGSAEIWDTLAAVMLAPSATSMKG